MLFCRLYPVRELASHSGLSGCRHDDGRPDKDENNGLRFEIHVFTHGATADTGSMRRSFSARRSLLMAASRFRAADFERWGSE
jgi:hypothetical protein